MVGKFADEKASINIIAIFILLSPKNYINLWIKIREKLKGEIIYFIKYFNSLS